MRKVLATLRVVSDGGAFVIDNNQIDVFDSMISTREEIENAAYIQGVKDIVYVKEDFLSEKEYFKYIEYAALSEEQAVELLFEQKKLEVAKANRKDFLKKRIQWRLDAENIANQQPIYDFIDIVSENEDIKISEEILKQRYGLSKRNIKKIDSRVLGGKLDPKYLLNIVEGFSNVEDLIEKLVQARTKKKFINKYVRDLVKEYLFDESDSELRAKNLIGRTVIDKFKAVRELLSNKELVEKVYNEISLKDIETSAHIAFRKESLSNATNVKAFFRMARIYAKKYKEAYDKKDFTAARKFKEEELKSYYLADDAYNFSKYKKTQDNRLKEYVKSHNLAKYGKKITMPYFKQIVKIIEYFNLAPISEKTNKKLQLNDVIDLNTFLELKGKDIVSPVLFTIKKGTLTPVDYMTIIDSIKSLIHNGVQSQNVLVEEERIKLSKAKEKILNIIGNIEVKSNVVKRELDKELLTLEGLLKTLSGDKTDSILFSLFYDNIKKASDNVLKKIGVDGIYTKKIEKVAELLNENKDIFEKRYDGFSLTDIFVMLLNYGNKKNKLQLLSSNNIFKDNIEITNKSDVALLERQAYVEKLFQNLPSSMLEAANIVWDIYNQEFETSNKIQQYKNGLALIKETPTPLVIGGVTLNGGYYPLKYDNEYSKKDYTPIDTYTSEKASTSSRLKEDRVVFVKDKNVSLDFSNIIYSLNEEIHDNEFYIPMDNINKILNYEDVFQSLENVLGKGSLKPMTDTYTDIKQRFKREMDTGAMSRLLNHVKNNVTFSLLFYKMTTASKQLIGFFPAMSQVNPVKLLINTKKYIFDMKNLKNFVNGLDPEMKNITNIFNSDVADIVNSLQNSLSNNKFYRNYLALSKLALVQLDGFTRYSIWITKYNEVIEGNMLEGETPSEFQERAVIQASRAARMTQGSGLDKDLSPVQRGNVYKKTLTMFYSVFNAGYNLLSSTLSSGDYFNFMKSLLLISYAPALTEALIFSDYPDEDELTESQYNKAIQRYILGIALSPLNFIPIARSIPSMLLYRGGFSPLDTVAYDINSLYNAINKEDPEIYDIIEKSGSVIGSVLTKLPVGLYKDFKKFYKEYMEEDL
jgi:hypothetical protein